LIKRLHKRPVLIVAAAIAILLALTSMWFISLNPIERASAVIKINQIIVYGAVSGPLYALLALGFTLIYGVAGVVNMTHGALFMLGAYMFFAFGPLGFFQLEILPALILAAIFVGIVGSIIYALTVHPIVEDELAVLVVTVGVALILQQLIIIGFNTAFKATYLAVPTITFAGLPLYVTFMGVKLASSSLLVCGVSVALFSLVLIFISKAKIGRAMRAVAQDREAAMLMGINTTRLYMLTMAISASLAATAGIFIASSTTGTAEPSMWLHPLVISFAVVILGGLGSLKGTIVGAFIVGYAENAVVILNPLGSSLAGAVALAIMVLVLLIRPRGIFGKRIEME